jgi:hypothetical protein
MIRGILISPISPARRFAFPLESRVSSLESRIAIPLLCVVLPTLIVYHLPALVTPVPVPSHHIIPGILGWKTKVCPPKMDDPMEDTQNAIPLHETSKLGMFPRHDTQSVTKRSVHLGESTPTDAQDSLSELRLRLNMQWTNILCPLDSSPS